MAVDFPSSPTPGQVYTQGGVTWTFDGVKWTAAGASAGTYLPLLGGTMTGDLILNRDAQVALGAATKQSVDARGAGDNRIINGDMRIDQRNNGAVVTPVPPNAYLVDRWQYYSTQTGVFGAGRNFGTPVALPLGFPYYLAFGVSAVHVPLAGDALGVSQAIEADFVSDLQWGTPNAQPVTLSFWAYAAVGTYSGAIRNYAANRSYPFSFLLPNAVWTKIVVIIPGDTAGTWVMSGNNGALFVSFDLGSGANFRSTANAWQAGNFVGVTGAVNVCATVGAGFFVTGVKLEVGSVATPFNRQSLAKSQADCERYFRWLPFNFCFWAGAASQAWQTGLSFPAMRASPTVGAPAADPNTSAGNFNNGVANFALMTPYSALVSLLATNLGQTYLQGYRASASAEL